MTLDWLPVVVVDICGAAITLVLAVLCVRYSLEWSRGKSQDILARYILYLTLAIAIFAVSRSFGHIVKQALLLTDRGSVWQQISPFSGALNTATFIVVFSISITFHRFSAIHRELQAHRDSLQTLVRERTAELEQANTHLTAINERLRKVVDTTRDLAVCSDADMFGSILLDEFAKHMLATGGSLYFVEDDGLRRVHAIESAHAPEFIAFPLAADSILRRTVEGKKPLLIENIAQEQDLSPSGWNGYRDGSLLAFPLPDEDGRVVGVLTLHSKAPPPFIEQDREIGAILASYSCETLRATRATETLRASEARFRDMAEMLPEGIFETGPNGELTYANRRTLDLTGYDPGDLVKGVRALDLIVPEERKRAAENQAKRSLGQRIGAVEYRGMRKDGSTFPALVHASPILKAGEPAGFRGVVIDLSESRQAEEEKAHLEEQYRQSQKVEAIGRLAGAVAHDLNNLLSPILCYGDMLKEDLGADDERLELVTEIVHAGEGARDLVRQLLAFGRKQTLEYRPLNVNGVIRAFEKLLRRTLREDIEFEIIPGGDIQLVNADIGQLEQVIMNLVVNARDAMAEGGNLTLRTAMVELDGTDSVGHPGAEPGQYVMMTFTDNGCGMSNEIRERIFEPFFSTKGERGTGLGLATVYGIVKQHGGNIWVDTAVGRGTTFEICLPVSQDTHVEDRTVKRVATDLHGTETILVAEDNKQVRQLVLAILEERGYTVLAATNGAEALAILDTYDGPIHMLFTDVVMPEMNGKNLASKAADKHPGLKILFCSGYTGDVITRRGVLEEGIAFIQKPFQRIDLQRRVREVLDEA